MGLAPPVARVEGTVLFEGRDIKTLPKHEAAHFWGTKMAMVFQDPSTSLSPVRRIRDQISAPLRYHLGLSKADARKRALELLSLVRIPDAERRLDLYPHELSGGMRQRIAIAIALSCHPRVLVADEPTTALDVTVQHQILDLLQELQGELGMAVILITHDLGVIAGRADRVAVMYGGRFVETARTDVLFRNMRHRYTRALFDAIPKLHAPSHALLEGIPGRPPDIAHMPPGCAFAPRCSYPQDRCRSERPELMASADTSEHRHACFFPLEGASSSVEEVVASREAEEASIAESSTTEPSTTEPSTTEPSTEAPRAEAPRAEAPVTEVPQPSSSRGN
jgi:peptide/nickel transport system ATP-binding protein